VLVQIRLTASKREKMIEIIWGITLFVIGVMGFFVIKKNLIIILMSIELMLIGISTNFVVFSIYMDDLLGQMVAIIILVTAAAESAIGLAILVIYYRIRGVIKVNMINVLKG
jgi:NADH-quinone oxidoreductase subunit K